MNMFNSLKNQPDEIRLAIPTQAGIGHLTHAMLEKEAGIKVTHIPYKGGGPAAVDALGGHVDALIITLAAVTEYIKNGQLIPLAVSTPERSPQFPDVPTMAEAGYPNTVVESWQGMLAPRDTPRPIVDKLHRDILAVMNDPDVQKKAESLGFRVAPMDSVDAFNEWIQAEYKKHGQTIRDAGISSE